MGTYNQTTVEDGFSFKNWHYVTPRTVNASLIIGREISVGEVPEIYVVKVHCHVVSVGADLIFLRIIKNIFLSLLRHSRRSLSARPDIRIFHSPKLFTASRDCLLMHERYTGYIAMVILLQDRCSTFPFMKLHVCGGLIFIRLSWYGRYF